MSRGGLEQVIAPDNTPVRLMANPWSCAPSRPRRYDHGPRNGYRHTRSRQAGQPEIRAGRLRSTAPLWHRALCGHRSYEALKQHIASTGGRSVSPAPVRCRKRPPAEARGVGRNRDRPPSTSTSSGTSIGLVRRRSGGRSRRTSAAEISAMAWCATPSGFV
jgi:hypothetical protein